jgi:uncharacterized protein Smg (DUF494 family)
MNPKVMDVVGFIGRIMAENFDSLVDQHDLKEELMGLGFSNQEITHAFKWIEDTTLGSRMAEAESKKPKSKKLKADGSNANPTIQPPFRALSPMESAKLKPPAQGLLMSFYNRGLLDSLLLEEILEKVLRSHLEEIGVRDIRRIAALTLFGRVQGDWTQSGSGTGTAIN